MQAGCCRSSDSSVPAADTSRNKVPVTQRGVPPSFQEDSRPDDVTCHWCVEAAGAGDVLRVATFAKGETDEGLDIQSSVVVEGVLVVIRHPARGQFPAVVELQVREARLVAFCPQ